MERFRKQNKCNFISKVVINVLLFLKTITRSFYDGFIKDCRRVVWDGNSVGLIRSFSLIKVIINDPSSANTIYDHLVNLHIHALIIKSFFSKTKCMVFFLYQ